MKRTIPLVLLGALGNCTPSVPAAPAFSDALEPAALMRVMKAAADWQVRPLAGPA